MGSHRFDTLVRHLYGLKNRREGLRVLLAGLAAGVLGPAAVAEAADCQGKGASCDQNEDCCSGVCRFPGFKQREDGRAVHDGRAGQQRVAAERRGKKGKKGKNCRKANKGRVGPERRPSCKRDGKGMCLCSRLQQRCNKASDCCEETQACEDNGCEEHTVCCKREFGAPCDDDCDCCGDRSFCDEDSRTCEDCGSLKETQEGPCKTTADCCFEDDVCESIDPACEGREGDKQCCVPVDKECEEDCDCCSPSKCDQDLDPPKCVAPSCLEPGEQQCSLGGGRFILEGVNGPNGACCEPTVCAPISCNETSFLGCCLPDRAQGCSGDCDCCDTLVCDLSVGGQCKPAAAVCPDDPELDGCIFEKTCNRAFQTACRCFRRNNQPLCALIPGSCFECANDADCVAQTDNPTAVCVPCELCGGALATSACVIPC